MKTLIKSFLAFAVTTVASGTVLAASDEMPWVIKVGAHVVDPKSSNGHLADGSLSTHVGTDIKPTITVEYMFADNWGVEALAAIPFQHNVSLNGTKAATIKHLPPTVSLQYHWMPESTISPFAGIGLNYTAIYSENETGPLKGADLSLDNSWGIAAHVGFDVQLKKEWLFAVDMRWINLDSQARVNGANVGTVHVDPLVYGIAIGHRF